ncbi:MAG: branched-chain amino acid ABC transporter permease [bacterium]|nr:branched-chain amino acid ABC transporter permease [bacterium]
MAFSNRQVPFRPDTSINDPLVLQVAGRAVNTDWLLLTIPVVTVVLVLALSNFVNRTRLGKAMRATAQDAEVAQMMGVSVDKVIATTFLLGSILAAAGGAMWGLNFGSLNQPAILGILPGIKAFAAAVIGGIGSLPGAVIGAVIIGFSENFLTALFPRTDTFQGITEFKDTFAFVLLIVVLLVRPSGIVGEDLTEKV